MNDEISNYQVTDRQTFVEFVKLLKQDFLKNQESWENKKLEDFLEALSSYAEDIQGYYDNSKPFVNADEPNWQTFADIFKGASLYE
jgi:methionyl-tRNA synthetase